MSWPNGRRVAVIINNNHALAYVGENGSLRQRDLADSDLKPGCDDGLPAGGLRHHEKRTFES
jgi:hypothetical protein